METEQQIEPEHSTKGTMTIEDAVIEKLRILPPERKQQVLDFVEFLEQRSAAKRPRRSLKGIWAGLGYSISEEDIAEARRQMWGNFPREDI
jgi:Protein of unknown function (DUF2281)